MSTEGLMKKIIQIIAVSVCLSIVQSSVTHADDTQPLKKMYVEIKGGIFSPNSDGNETSNDGGLKEFDSGFNFEGAFGARYNKYFALESGVGVYAADTKETIRTSVSATNGKVVVVPITISAIAILPIDIVDLFAGVGFGYYSSTLKFATATTSGNFNQEYSAGALGYQLIGGIDINLTQHIAVGAEIKYFEAKPEFDLPLNTKVKVNVGGTIINGGFKFRF